MSLANFIEAEDPRRLDVKPSSSGVLGDLLERYIRQREAGSSKRKTRKKSQIDAARHLLQRIKVGERTTAAEPAGKTSTATSAEHGQRVKHDAVADQVEYCI